MSPRKAEPPTIEFVLLGLIHYQPTHGYDLLQTLRKGIGIGMIWHIKPGRLYALLDKLENLGWLQATVKPGDGFLQRKEYQTSEAGERALQDWMITPVSAAHRMRQEFLARLYFASQKNTQVVTNLIDIQVQTCFNWLASLQCEAQKLSSSESFEQMVFSFRIGQIQAMIDWLETCKAQYTA